MVLSGIIAFIITLTLDLYTDTQRHWGNVKHGRGAVLRGLGLILSAGLVTRFNFLTPLFYEVLFLFCSIFWVVFEYGIKFIRKLPLNYVGNTATSDKWLRRNGGFKMKVILQALCFITSLVLLLI